MSDLPPKLFRVADVAARWACSNQTVYNLIRRGDLLAIRIGALYRIRTDDITAYENRKYSDGHRSVESATATTTTIISNACNPRGSRDMFHLGQKIANKNRTLKTAG